jgi:hypothetical protein
VALVAKQTHTSHAQFISSHVYKHHICNSAAAGILEQEVIDFGGFLNTGETGFGGFLNAGETEPTDFETFLNTGPADLESFLDHVRAEPEVERFLNDERAEPGATNFEDVAWFFNDDVEIEEDAAIDFEDGSESVVVPDDKEVEREEADREEVDREEAERVKKLFRFPCGAPRPQGFTQYGPFYFSCCQNGSSSVWKGVGILLPVSVNRAQASSIWGAGGPLY